MLLVRQNRMIRSAVSVLAGLAFVFAGVLQPVYADDALSIAGGSTAAQLVASGKVDLCVISVEPALVGYEKGLRLQFFLSRQSQYSYVLGVLNDSPIRRLEDFKGKEIGEVTAGSLSEVAADSMLEGRQSGGVRARRSASRSATLSKRQSPDGHARGPRNANASIDAARA
jgi:hypothetical protein